MSAEVGDAQERAERAHHAHRSEHPHGPALSLLPAVQRCGEGGHDSLRRCCPGNCLIGGAAMQQDIPGTIMFDGAQAQKGLALNRMCFSFNSAENRAAFLKDEDAYCRRYELSDEQRAAVKSRNVLEMIKAGGNVYYLAKLAGIFGLNVQDIGAQQTGMSVDAFKAKLAASGR